MVRETKVNLKKIKVMKNKVRKHTILRNLQLISFIMLCILSLGILVLIGLGLIPPITILAGIPIALMMKINVISWDRNDMLVILMKCFDDEKYREKFMETNKSK